MLGTRLSLVACILVAGVLATGNLPAAAQVAKAGTCSPCSGSEDHITITIENFDVGLDYLFIVIPGFNVLSGGAVDPHTATGTVHITLTVNVFDPALNPPNPRDVTIDLVNVSDSGADNKVDFNKPESKKQFPQSGKPQFTKGRLQALISKSLTSKGEVSVPDAIFLQDPTTYSLHGDFKVEHTAGPLCPPENNPVTHLAGDRVLNVGTGAKDTQSWQLGPQ